MIKNGILTGMKYDLGHAFIINEPRHETTCLRGFWPGKTQTGLPCHRD